MEPARANGAIVSARRGVGTYVLNIEGKASHSGIAPEQALVQFRNYHIKSNVTHSLMIKAYPLTLA